MTVFVPPQTVWVDCCQCRTVDWCACKWTVASVGLWTGVHVSQHLIRNFAESKQIF